MAQVERIWRITTDTHGAIDIRLAGGPDGEPQVQLERLGGEDPDGVFAVDAARAVAQAILEACEVASALSEPLAMAR